jgi:hypothetical protein
LTIRSVGFAFTSWSRSLDAHLAGAIGRDERVVGDEAHLERLGPVGHELADPAEADDAERLVGQLDALPGAALPTPIDERGVRLGDVPGLCQEQGHRVLGRRDDVGLRRVHDHHATRRRRLDVDVVEADARAADDDQLVGGSEHLGRHLGGRPDDECAGARDRGEQLVRGQADPNVDVVAGGPEAVETTVGDCFGDEDARHGPMLI